MNNRQKNFDLHVGTAEASLYSKRRETIVSRKHTIALSAVTWRKELHWTETLAVALKENLWTGPDCTTWMHWYL